jgi:hypothetical protein
MQQHLDSLKNNTQTHVQNSKQYLESVGQYLQQALSPFGINCDYHVDEQKPTTNEQQEEQTSTTDTVPTPEPSAVPKHPDSTQDNDNNNQEQTASSSTPLLEESTKITNPLEKTIDDCMERMKAMGFIDANGALRDLVRSKQGDINAVLDAINPRHFQA